MAEKDLNILKDLIVLIISRYGNNNVFFSKVRMQKFVFFTNYLYAWLNQNPVCNITYIKKPREPVSNDVEEALQLLQKEGRIAIESIDNGSYGETQYELLNPTQTTYIDQTIFNHIDVDLQKLKNTYGSKLSHLSHQLRAWEIGEMGEEIPFDAFFTQPQLKF